LNRTVYIPRKIHTAGIDYLSKRGYTIAGLDAPNERQLLKALGECDAVILRAVNMTAKLIEAAKKLKIIAFYGVGLDSIDLEAAAKRDILVINTKGSNTNAVAEHTVGLILAINRHILPLSKALSKGKFYIKDDYIGSELAGKSLGIVGLGNIGRAVAKKAALGFDMKVFAYRYRVDPESLPDYIELVDWEELFKNSDIVSIHIPGRKENAKLIGKHEFNMMKEDAILINVARGSVVDEQALIKALKVGQIRGAGLDVFETEPPELQNPLLHLENVVAVPHIGSNTQEAQSLMSLDIARQIHQFFAGGSS
jgi:D-3-phosphoglycerate dehydrogenase